MALRWQYSHMGLPLLFFISLFPPFSKICELLSDSRNLFVRVCFYALQIFHKLIALIHQNKTGFHRPIADLESDDDHFFPRLDRVRRAAVHDDLPAAPLAQDHVGLQALAGGIAHYKNFLAWPKTGLLHEVFIDGDADDVIDISIGHRSFMDL